MVLPSWYPPRGGQFFREHSQAIAQAGARVNVLALNPKGLKSMFSQKEKTGNDFAWVRDFKEEIRPYPVIPFSARANAKSWTRQLTRMTKIHLASQGEPDLIQVHSSMWAGLVAARIKRDFGIPYVLTEHRGRFISDSLTASALFRKWHIPLLREAFEGADIVVTVSQALQAKILEISPACRDKMVTIPNMVDTRFFSTPLNKKPPPPFVFFCLAHLDPLKGVDTLIRAADLLIKKGEVPIRLLIGGEGSQKAQLREMVRKSGNESFISFSGHLEREGVRHCLHRAHAFVLPSRFEAFGVVFIEAMACGLPVIASNAGGASDFVGRETGLLVPPDDPVRLARAMELITKTLPQYNPESVRNHVQSNFSKGVVAEKYLELYKSIIPK